MAYHHLLLKWHPMVGCDFHLELTFSWPPLPVPEHPHLVGQRLAGFGGASMTGDDVLANNWNIIQRDSDIQYGIPHIPLPPFPACVLAPLWTGISGSKSYFGPSSVLGNGRPVAAALAIWVNPQINCDDPLPNPTGIAISWSNVVCGLTWGDIFGGLLSILIDRLVTKILNKVGEGIAGKFKIGDRIAQFYRPELRDDVFNAVNTLAGTVVQQITGSPVGYTFSIPRHLFDDKAHPWVNPANWGTGVGHSIGEWLGRATGLDSPAPAPTSVTTSSLINDPTVEQH